MELIPATISMRMGWTGYQLYAGRGAGFILAILQRLGVRTIIAIPGLANAPILSAVRRSRRLATRNAVRGGSGLLRLRIMDSDYDSAFEAIRFSFETENPTVLLLPSGPGALKVLPALRVALRSRVPILCITPSLSRLGDQSPNSGDVELNGHRGLLDHARIFGSFCKNTYRIQALEQCEAVMQTAWSVACAEPAGPVHIEIDAALLRRWTLRRVRFEELTI